MAHKEHSQLIKIPFIECKRLNLIREVRRSHIYLLILLLLLLLLNDATPTVASRELRSRDVSSKEELTESLSCGSEPTHTVVASVATEPLPQPLVQHQELSRSRKSL
jgi:uncharacterized membrane protein